jgi:hypothetical protein
MARLPEKLPTGSRPKLRPQYHEAFVQGKASSDLSQEVFPEHNFQVAGDVCPQSACLHHSRRPPVNKSAGKRGDLITINGDNDNGIAK